MSNYLMKYKGAYRLKAHIDQSTNDFPRDTDGTIDTDDVYIKCANKCQIYHYGRGILVAYIPSIGRGHNILKALGQELCSTPPDISYEELYSTLRKEGTIRDIVENDEEIEFKFHNKYIGLISKYLKTQVAGANISPFSSRNLPKSDYVIPAEELNEYKEIIRDIPKGESLIIPKITRGFIENILKKSQGYRTKNIDTDMKLKKLKTKNISILLACGMSILLI